MNTRRVVCAAIRKPGGSILLGIRHYSADMHFQIKMRKDGDLFLRLHGDNQGFVDQFGKYLTRAEAYIVAKEAGQIINEKACSFRDGFKELYSEALY